MRSSVEQPSQQIVEAASAWFIEFRTGSPSQGERDRFSAWLRLSPQHIQAYLEVAAAWSELPEADPDQRIDLEKMMALARQTPPNVVRPDSWNAQRAAPTRASKWRGSLALPLTLAASILVVIAVGFTVWLQLLRSDYITGTGEQHTVQLADGSTIEINAQSAVRVRFTDDERYVELVRGQALFKVAKDSARPFIVRAGDARIRAVGTQFDVYRKQLGTTVTVIEGRVSVAKNAVGTAEPVLLDAGEQMAIASDALVKVSSPDLRAATAWTQKRLVFEETPLAEVADEFNRYNARPLRIDPALQRVAISGLYSSTDPTSLIAFLRAQPHIQVIESDSEIRIQLRQAPPFSE